MKIKLIAIFHFTILFFLMNIHLISQIDTNILQKKITYKEFLNLINKRNLNLISQLLDINISEANILSSKAFPDPEISFGYFNNGQERMNMGYGFTSSINWTIELGGKRKSRIELAQSEYELTKVLVRDFYRHLIADGTVAFLDVLLKKSILNFKLSSYKTMYKLAQSDSIRFQLGSINKLDAIQSKLESESMLNEVYQAEAEWKISMSKLFSYIGINPKDTFYMPYTSFTNLDRNFNLSQLIELAIQNRTDLLAALQNKKVSEKLLKLAQSNRVFDLNISIGNTYASYDRNIIAPTPSFNQFYTALGIPLKFSNNYPGEIKMGYFKKLQSELQYKQIEIEVKSQVIEAYYNYLAQQKQINQFNTGLLNEAKIILEGKIYSYQRGETTLLEVLNAQRTYNDLQQSYYETLYNYAVSLIELEKAIGIWDIQL